MGCGNSHLKRRINENISYISSFFFPIRFDSLSNGIDFFFLGTVITPMRNLVAEEKKNLYNFI